MEITTNVYNDISVKLPSDLPMDLEEFKWMVGERTAEWKTEGRSAIWFSIPVNRSDLIPSLIDLGFVPHHCNSDYFMLTKWLSETSANKLPNFGTHIVRIEAVIVREQPTFENGNRKRCEALLVKEAFGHGEGYKLLSGSVEQGEYIEDAAVREVYEETGLRVKFVSILGYGNRTSVKYGRNELFFICHMRLVDETRPNAITLQDGELKEARWFDVKEIFADQRMLKGLQKKCLNSAINRRGMMRFMPNEDTGGQQRLRAHYVGHTKEIPRIAHHQPYFFSDTKGTNNQCQKSLDL
jgi:ADP-ribose/NAD+ diphosphatase